MKKIMWIGSILLLSSQMVVAQNQTRPVQPVRPVNHVQPVPNTTNKTDVLINNTNGTPLNQNKKDMNSTQPGDNQPANRVITTPPTQNPVIIDNTQAPNPPVIYTTPVQNPQTPAAPATNQTNQMIIQR